MNLNMTDKVKVRAGKIAAFAVGSFGILIGILLKGLNVSFLVGLAFAVAASAIFPLDNPGIISIPLSFLTLILVSLYTAKKKTGNIAN